MVDFRNMTAPRSSREPSSPRDNRLLDTLSLPALERFDLQLVNALHGDELLPPYEPITHLYFPTSAVVAVAGTMADGDTAGVGIIGSEGAIGIVGLMGAGSSPYGKVVQKSGALVRVPREQILHEFDSNVKFRRGILSFVEKFSSQVAQTALCNRWHNVEERLMRWLLLSHDRIDGDVLRLTHEFLALMLGASRVRITQAAKRLQEMGYIKYVRGKVTILDRVGMEANACECLDVIRRAYQKGRAASPSFYTLAA